MKALLRPYQVEAIEQIRAAIRTGKRRILLTVPTGGGKTLTAASMIAGALARGKRSQFVAHRKELIDQTVTAFARLGITSVGVVRAGDKRRDSTQPIQVASIQTLANRLQPDFDLVFVDEAHRANAASYAKHVFERHQRAIIIGLTATPCRGDGKPLGSMFEELVVGARYSELIAGGFLAAPNAYSTPMLPDLSTVRTTAGEYNQADLEDAVNRGALIGDLYTQWAKHPPARTVAFAVSVAHSRAIVERFTAEGVRAEHLDGTTPEDERAAILARLASGATTLVSNVGVLCEGWDLPSCKRLILARPTKSLGLYMQCAGRILRPHDGEIPIILDHGGNWDRHGAPHQDREWSLDAKPKRIGIAPSRVCPECFGHILASARTCPLCGAAQPEPAAPERDRGPRGPRAEDVIVDLALRSLSAVDDVQGDATRLEKFRGLYLVARERGWMPGAVVHRYRELLGEEAPASWVAALKSDYRNDGAWRAAVAQRKRERNETAVRYPGREKPSDDFGVLWLDVIAPSRAVLLDALREAAGSVSWSVKRWMPAWRGLQQNEKRWRLLAPVSRRMSEAERAGIVSEIGDRCHRFRVELAAASLDDPRGGPVEPTSDVYGDPLDVDRWVESKALKGLAQALRSA